MVSLTNLAYVRKLSSQLFDLEITELTYQGSKLSKGVGNFMATPNSLSCRRLKKKKRLDNM